jgi:hypothetical protein
MIALIIKKAMDKFDLFWLCSIIVMKHLKRTKKLKKGLTFIFFKCIIKNVKFSRNNSRGRKNYAKRF